MANIAHRSRILLINSGKILPFLVCFVVAISDIECVYALLTQDYIVMGDFVYLNKPISWQIGKVFECNIQIIIVLTIISFAIQACKWNKLAIVYLSFQLYEKRYFANHQFENTNIYYVVIAINLILCAFFVTKGLQRLKRKQD